MRHSSLKVSLTYLRGLEVDDLKEEDTPMIKPYLTKSAYSLTLSTLESTKKPSIFEGLNFGWKTGFEPATF